MLGYDKEKRMENMMASESRLRANAKYAAKAYKKYEVSFRFDTDEELIDYIKEHEDIGVTEILRRAMDLYVRRESGK